MKYVDERHVERLEFVSLFDLPDDTVLNPESRISTRPRIDSAWARTRWKL